MIRTGLLLEKMQSALQRALPFSGICFRNGSRQFANTQGILSAQGSMQAGGRFNDKGSFEVLYLSCDLHTCLEETTKSLQRSGFEIAQALPRTVIGIEVKLDRILDLTDFRMRSRLGINQIIDFDKLAFFNSTVASP